MRRTKCLFLTLALAALALAACGGGSTPATPTLATTAPAIPTATAVSAMPTPALPPAQAFRPVPSIAPATILSAGALIDVQQLPAVDSTLWQRLVASDAGLTAAVPPGWDSSSNGTLAKIATWKLVEVGGKGITPRPGDATVDMVMTDSPAATINRTDDTTVLAVFSVPLASGPAELVVGTAVSPLNGSTSFWAFLTAPAGSGRILTASGGVTLPATAERLAEFITAVLSVRIE